MIVCYSTMMGLPVAAWGTCCFSKHV